MARRSSVLSPRPPPHPLQDVSRAEYVVLSRDVHNALYNHHFRVQELSFGDEVLTMPVRVNARPRPFGGEGARCSLA